MSRPAQNRRNYYRLLQVQPDAPAEVIKASYRTMMQKLRFHPDLGGDDWNAALLNEAMETLGDPVRRAAYDSQLDQSRAVLAQDQAAATAAANGARGGTPRHGVNGHCAEPGHAPSEPRCLSSCAFCGSSINTLATGLEEAECARCLSPLTPPFLPRGTSSENEQRALERIRHDMDVHFMLEWPAKRIHRARALDVSLQGMRITSRIAVATGTPLKLHCSVLNAVAVVISQVQAGNDSHELGLEFKALKLLVRQSGFVSTKA